MSTNPNIQSVQRIYEAFGRGNVPAILEHIGEPVDWIHPGSPTDYPWAGARRTREDVVAFFKVLKESVEVIRFEPQKYLADGDMVVALGYFEARARSTGRVFKEQWAMEWTFRAARVIKHRIYEDTAAVAAAFK